MRTRSAYFLGKGRYNPWGARSQGDCCPVTVFGSGAKVGEGLKDVLQAALDSCRILARPDDGRLHLLDPAGTVVWDLHCTGIAVGKMAGLLAQHFGTERSTTQIQVESLLNQLRLAGLVDNRPSNADIRFSPKNWVLDAPRLTPVSPEESSFILGDVPISFSIANSQLEFALRTHLQPLRRHSDGMVAHNLWLAGTPEHWCLYLNDRVWAEGCGIDEACVTVLNALVDVACRAHDRLIVIHGAGLRLNDGRGVLLIAPGGHGKTTLAAALNAEGMGLLGDDVVPVTMNGDLLALGTPLCLKSGSWPILTNCRPELMESSSIRRFGQEVRYLVPLGPSVRRPVRPSFLLFPQYQTGSSPQFQRLDAVSALRNIIEAESVIRNLTQAKLQTLAQWVSTIPAYRLVYPDLASGSALVHHILALPSQA